MTLSAGRRSRHCGGDLQSLKGVVEPREAQWPT
jgi:hypothetical protein